MNGRCIWPTCIGITFVETYIGMAFMCCQQIHLCVASLRRNGVRTWSTFVAMAFVCRQPNTGLCVVPDLCYSTARLRRQASAVFTE
jgi:hypothetical protein